MTSDPKVKILQNILINTNGNVSNTTNNTTSSSSSPKHSFSAGDDVRLQTPKRKRFSLLEEIGCKKIIDLTA